MSRLFKLLWSYMITSLKMSAADEFRPKTDFYFILFHIIVPPGLDGWKSRFFLNNYSVIGTPTGHHYRAVVQWRPLIHNLLYRERAAKSSASQLVSPPPPARTQRCYYYCCFFPPSVSFFIVNASLVYTYIYTHTHLHL